MSITDIPADLNEFYGSLISMDDPRHAKIRRIVVEGVHAAHARAADRLVQQIVERRADPGAATAEAGDGTIDVVADIAAPIPLRVICDMMGIPEADRPMVLAKSNIVLSGGDPEPDGRGRPARRSSRPA